MVSLKKGIPFRVKLMLFRPYSAGGIGKGRSIISVFKTEFSLTLAFSFPSCVRRDFALPCNPSKVAYSECYAPIFLAERKLVLTVGAKRLRFMRERNYGMELMG